jgi:hypothetical protein
MPFKPEFNFPTTQPLVRVFFNGLMIAKPDATGSECEVFVHRTALDHELSIEIRLKQPNKPDAIIMRHLGPLELLQETPQGKKYGFIIRTNTPKGVSAYRGAPAEGEAIDRVIDLNVFHPGKTAVHRNAAQPTIFMTDGLFYCAQKAVPGLEVELQTAQASTLVMPLREFSTLLGANIYSNNVNVAWREKGQVRAFPLTNDIPAGAYYEIYITNDPAYVPMPQPGSQPHDELSEYYKLLPNVPSGEQYKLFYKRIPGQEAGTPIAPADKGSLRIPCMTVVDTGP